MLYSLPLASHNSPQKNTSSFFGDPEEGEQVLYSLPLASLGEGEQVLSCLPPCLPLRGRWHGEAVTEGVKYSFVA